MKRNNDLIKDLWCEAKLWQYWGPERGWEEWFHGRCVFSKCPGCKNPSHCSWYSMQAKCLLTDFPLMPQTKSNLETTRWLCNLSKVRQVYPATMHQPWTHLVSPSTNQPSVGAQKDKNTALLLSRVQSGSFISSKLLTPLKSTFFLSWFYSHFLTLKNMNPFFIWHSFRYVKTSPGQAISITVFVFGRSTFKVTNVFEPF